MNTFEQEYLLVEPVSKYIVRRGFTYLEEELQFFEYKIDIYCFSRKSHLAVAIELKLAKWKEALKQALRYRLCADLVYVAVPQRTATRLDPSPFQEYGVGLIKVGPNRCQEILAPVRSSYVRPHYRNFYIEHLTFTS